MNVPLLSFALSVTVAAQMIAPVKAAEWPIPTVNARTTGASKKIIRTESGSTRTAQDSRSMGVDVGVRFFSKPPATYEVQCFFIAKDTKGDRFIFDLGLQSSSVEEGQFQFDSESLAGGSKSSTYETTTGTFSGTTFGGTPISGTVELNTFSASSRKGSKIEGWVVRVVGEGKVLRVESNQPALRDTAVKKPQEMDALVAAKKQGKK